MSKLVGERLLSAPPALVWMGLHDAGIMRKSNPACESLEHLDERNIRAVLVLKAGPVTGRFVYRIRLEDLDPPHGYTARFEADGGISGYRVGVVHVRLVPEHGGTRLHYEVEATTRGRIAELAGDEMDAAAARLFESLASAFEKNLRELAGTPRGRAAPEPADPVRAAPANAVSSPDRPSWRHRRVWRWLLVAIGLAALITWAFATGDAPTIGEPSG